MRSGGAVRARRLRRSIRVASAPPAARPHRPAPTKANARRCPSPASRRPPCRNSPSPPPPRAPPRAPNSPRSGLVPDAKRANPPNRPDPITLAHTRIMYDLCLIESESRTTISRDSCSLESHSAARKSNDTRARCGQHDAAWTRFFIPLVVFVPAACDQTKACEMTHA
ncbi:hypothetical protein EVAR_40714_1 [Eumeta japonica]|uniref:Uncharacterized protein n=1 Tax=Eumeta variegata TaxID=151549 RepID=A0A4C1X6B4_EUMVA|nr:hypothetical protein EVAR_40714_1 [Eumeta japonica]